MTPFERCERDPKSERIDVVEPAGAGVTCGGGPHDCCGGTEDELLGPATAIPLETGGGVRLGTGGGPYALGGGV
jgi:hypothetical protein